ncbi:hypothetical protein [Gallaecimonas sp. GXIMD4217]|uniref:hypothetical protein n=1 Tax=Gallaecimonas sp. GXIMD4217 TaxID=3131927 RepID=UPI00311B0CC0
MWVRVIQDWVIARMHFPFSVFTLPELFGLGWEFEKNRLISCSKTPWGVRVRYAGTFCAREFVVHVGDRDGFINAIGP